MTLEFFEYVLGRLTSWPVIVFAIVLMFRATFDSAIKMLVMTKLKDGVEDVIEGIDAVRARRKAS